MAEFLLEIGFEEMPAPWLADLTAQLRTKFDTLAGEAQLNPTATRVLWTSRRLVLVSDVKARQDDRTVIEFGPAAKIAKDPAGAWSKAAEGFAKKQGVALDALTLVPKVAGSADLFASATKHIAGRAGGEVLAALIAPLLRGFSFPKRMNWDAWLEDGRGAFEFGRPIQWIVALLHGEVIPFEIFDAVGGARGTVRLKSGRRSTGNRFYPRDAKDRGFDVKSFAELEAGLDVRFVVLDPANRAERIKEQVEKAGGKVEGETAHLVHEWCDLVEFPTIAVGSVPKEFADLPLEVLETVLAHHQKVIMLPIGSDGAPRFAAISGCDDAGAKNAALGQERVVVARLKDARFFWDEDRKKALADRVNDLAKITFQQGLGDYRFKAMRIGELAQHLLDWPGQSPGVPDVGYLAGRLSKADLATLMVREFPELQGTVGALYAASAPDVVPEAVAAVRWHYHPIAMGADDAPAGALNAQALPIFAAVSLADKLDTLVGYFGLGLLPTGSSDPYGLRRAAQGVIRVLIDFWPGPALNLESLIGAVHGNYPVLKKPEHEVVLHLTAFLIERLRAVLIVRGFAVDVIDAVVASPNAAPLANVRSTQLRVQALSTARAERPAEFAGLAESFKRAKNIVGDATAAVVDENLFVEDAERTLFAAIKNAEKTPSSDPAARLRAVAALRDDVDAFFKSVMVNAEDQSVRANRHALLRRLLDLVYEIADLSKLTAPAASGNNAA